MSRESYFKKFPIISYSNTAVRDVTRRVVITDKFRKNWSTYYPHTLREGYRADHLADAYYGDSYMDWIVYFGAGIIDPYYDWYMSQEVFDAHVREKWGSIELAQETILWWQVDWAGNEERLTQSGFNSLAEPLKKYYMADYGVGTRVLGYDRRKSDWMTTTNMVVRFEVEASTSNVEFLTVGENVRLKIGNTEHANGIVAWSNSTEVKIIHVFGNTAVANTVLVGQTSGANLAVTQHYFESNAIPIDERPYWQPVYAYDWEVTENKKNQIIKVIDAKYKKEISDGVELYLNEGQKLRRR